MESLALLEKLDNALKDDIKNLQSEANAAKKRSENLELENNNLKKLNEDLKRNYESATSKVENLEAEFSLIATKLKRKQDELLRKELWWDKYRFTAEMMQKKLRTLGAFPPGVLQELSRDLVDVMEETIANTSSGNSQESDGKKSMKLSVSKTNKKIRYAEVSPESREGLSSQDRQMARKMNQASPENSTTSSRTSRLTSDSIATSTNNNIIMESKNEGSQRSQQLSSSRSSNTRTSKRDSNTTKNEGSQRSQQFSSSRSSKTSTSKIDSITTRESEERRSQISRSSTSSSKKLTSPKDSKAATGSQKNTKLSKTPPCEPEAETVDFDDEGGIPEMTSTPMLREWSNSKVATPEMNMPDLSMILSQGVHSNAVTYPEGVQITHSLPVSDSQFPIDLTHTQPPSPTIPSKSESIFREADSSETLWSPGAGHGCHGNGSGGSHGDRSDGSHGNRSGGSYGDGSDSSQKSNRRKRNSQYKLNFQSSQTKTSQCGVDDNQQSGKAVDSRLNVGGNKMSSGSSKSMGNGSRSMGNEVQGSSKVPSARLVEGKVYLERLDHENEVPSPSILPVALMRSIKRDWHEESTVMYPGGGAKPRQDGDVINLISDDDDAKTPGAVGRTLEQQGDEVRFASRSNAAGTKRKRTSSDEMARSSKLQNPNLRKERESSSPSDDKMFKVPSGPVQLSGPGHRQRDVIHINEADDHTSSVILLSDVEADGRMETSCVDMFADSGAEPSKENLHVSNNLSVHENATLDRDDASTHDIKTSTPLSSTNQRELVFHWKSDAGEEDEDCPIGRKPKDLGYKNIEVVRKKDERAKLNGYSCRECEKYYGSMNLPEEELKKRLKACSRHRAKYSPPPSTPPGFWNLSFPETQEYIAKGCLKTGDEAQAAPSRYRQLKNRKKKPPQQSAE